MDTKVFLAMDRAMNGLAIDEGRKVLFKALFGDRWTWTSRAYYDEKMSVREFIRRTVSFDRMPDMVSIEFLDTYFSEEISSAYQAYCDAWAEQHKEMDDEADEQA